MENFLCGLALHSIFQKRAHTPGRLAAMISVELSCDSFLAAAKHFKPGRLARWLTMAWVIISKRAYGLVVALDKCSHRTSLFDAYRGSTDAYTSLVKQLRGAAEADYTFLHERVEKARQKMIAARENLNLHIAAHRCL